MMGTDGEEMRVPKKGMLGTITEWMTRPSRAERTADFESRITDAHPKLFSFAMRLAGNRPDAEDLLQEAYVRAFRHWDKFDASLSFSSWMHRVLVNAHIDGLRKKKRSPVVALDGIESEFVRDVADPAPDAAHLLQDRTFDPALESALARINPEFRIAVLLADVEGMAYEEIAEMMNTSVGTVRSRIHRGRKALRDRLLRDAPDFFAGADR